MKAHLFESDEPVSRFAGPLTVLCQATLQYPVQVFMFDEVAIGATWRAEALRLPYTCARCVAGRSEHGRYAYGLIDARDEQRLAKLVAQGAIAE